MAWLGSAKRLVPLENVKIVPYNPNATPTEQIMMYFHAASREVLCLYVPTKNAELNVVASMAAHIKITLLVITEIIMVKKNKCKKP